jgi:hypothetical protein
MELIGSNELERLWKETVLPNLGYYSSICLEGLKKIIMADVLKQIQNVTNNIHSRQTQVIGCNTCSVGTLCSTKIKRLKIF